MSRFFRRTAPTEPKADAEPLPPPTSELILKPAAEAKVTVQPEPTDEQKKKLSELEEFTRNLHETTLSKEDDYWKWERRWLDEPGLYGRYMRAAKWDLNNAKKRIQGTLEWR